MANRSFLSLSRPRTAVERTYDEMGVITRRMAAEALAHEIAQQDAFFSAWEQMKATRAAAEQESRERCARITAYIRRTK